MNKQVLQILPDNTCKLVQGLRVRNPHTYQHCVRVSEYATACARLIDSDPNFVLTAHVAGLVHDVGKLLIPEVILHAPRKLSLDEKLLVDSHAENGANMLHEMDEVVREAIRLHHTNYIDLEDYNILACILKCCDVYDALTSERCYKAAMSRSDSLKIMMKGVGTEFEPVCFNALVATTAYVR